MKCPECGAWTIVKDTRKSPTFGYMRRRECANYHKFTTQEVIVPQEAIDAERKENVLKAGVVGRAKFMALHEGRRKSSRKTA
jgi:transcriptional regulator NrdR family protein